MQITDPAELKLIEKYREMKAKRLVAGDPGMTRSFSVPSQLDSDDMIHISVGLSCTSIVPSSSSMDVKTFRGVKEALQV